MNLFADDRICTRRLARQNVFGQGTGGSGAQFRRSRNPKTNAFLTFSRETALADAERVDTALAKGEYVARSPVCPSASRTLSSQKICGLPAGRASSRITFRPTTPRRFTGSARKARAIILGKLNCDEFAMGSSNENSAYGPVRYPGLWIVFQADRVVAPPPRWHRARQLLRSVRIREDRSVSRRVSAASLAYAYLWPCLAIRVGSVASSLDHIGPVCPQRGGCRAYLRVIAGRDDLDSTSAFAPVDDYHALMRHSVRGLKLGLPKEYFEGLTAETGDAFTPPSNSSNRWLRNSRSEPAAHKIRPVVLLHYRHGGSRVRISRVTTACDIRSAPRLTH